MTTDTKNTDPWVSICHIDDIPVLGSRRVERSQGAAVALFRTGTDAVFALLDRCPQVDLARSRI